MDILMWHVIAVTVFNLVLAANVLMKPDGKPTGADFYLALVVFIALYPLELFIVNLYVNGQIEQLSNMIDDFFFIKIANIVCQIN